MLLPGKHFVHCEKMLLPNATGDDISRKRKFLDIQKECKKRMKQISKFSIPQEAFLKI
jgi:GTP-binding protein LepA